jgi:thiamine-phosphate pyrophosphorylase
VLRYAITDRLRLATSEPARSDALLTLARECAAAGIEFLQLREKDLVARQLADTARAILNIFAEHNGTRPKLLINSRADVAITAHADGVHLSSAEGELTPEQVRTVYAAAGLPAPVVSMSCHTLAGVTRARSLAPSLILFGPVFEKIVSDPTTQHTTEALISRGTGLNLLHTACAAAAPIPVLALGGVTEANTPDCLAAGAAGIAAIRLFSH